MLSLYTDGGASPNPGACAIGGIAAEDAREVFIFSERASDGTNNQAEYRALLRGLELAREQGYRDIKCHVDSELVVRQLTGEYRIHDPALADLAKAVWKLAASMNCTFVLVRRNQNRRADSLVRKALRASEPTCRPLVAARRRVNRLCTAPRKAGL